MRKSGNKKNRRYYEKVREFEEIDEIYEEEIEEDEILEDEEIEEELVSGETLEFLSLDDEMIEAYNRAEEQKKKSSLFGKLKSKREEYEEDDWEDEDDIDEEDDWEDEDDIDYGDEEDDDDIDYDEEEYEYYAVESSKNIFTRIGDYIVNMSTMDRVVTLFGCFILMAAVATGSLYVNAKLSSNMVEAFAEVGADMSEIGIVGESGLIAVSDAESARIYEMVEIEQEVVEEEEKKNSKIEVSMKLTSIQADIKIKFVNKETNKLIGGLLFEVEVSNDNGKKYSLKDDDKDGIIYQTGVEAGTYTIKLVSLDGSEYEKYKFPSQASTISVKDTITYKEVDVADEVKTEAEVNVAVEDTAKQDTVVESALTDTVEWVESTKSGQDSDDNYQEIQKADIVDPSLSSKTNGFVKFTNIGTDGDVAGNTTGGTGSDTSGDTSGDTTGGTSSDTTGGTSGDTTGGTGSDTTGDTGGDTTGGTDSDTTGGTGSDTSGGTSGDTTGGTGSDTSGGTSGDTTGGTGGDTTGGTSSTTPSQPTDQEKMMALSPYLNSTSISLKKGENANLSVGVKTNAYPYTITWSGSSNNAVATVDNNGKVTAQGAGNAEISVVVTVGSKSNTLKCAVVVADYKIKSPSGTSSLKVGETGSVKAETDPVGGTVVWTSRNADIATVTQDGKTIKGIKEGTAVLEGKWNNVTVTWTVVVLSDKAKYTALNISGSETILIGKTGTLTAKTTPEGGTVTWKSDNESIAKIDDKGTLTGVAAGTATITATCKENTSLTKTWKVTVKKDASSDTQSKLKDKNGQQIYIKNAEGKYVEATYADYYRDVKFYLRKTDAVFAYTGWQTIDGYTYFFDKNGNKVTGEQVIQGAKYSFGSDGRLSAGSGTLGIDVSKWNGSIDWNAVKNSGVSYVIIRCGYRGSSTGALIEDPKFKSNIQGAKAAGLKVGVYFFSQAVNEVEAVEEASMTLNLIKGYGLDYPVFLDVEASGGRGDAVDVSTRTAVCKAFCATIQNSGYSAGIYANKTWFTSYMNTSSLTGYKLWLAQYASAPTYTATRYDMWQYSSKGSVSGISGNVDMNISYMSY